MQKAISYKHVLYQDGQRSEFRPNEALLAVALTWSAGGTATVFVYLAVFFLRAGDTPGQLIASALLLGAVLFIGFAIWAWLNRNTSLTVEADGSIFYGKKPLCAAGTVRSVRIADARSGEWGDCEVYLETDGEKLVPLPLSSTRQGQFLGGCRCLFTQRKRAGCGWTSPGELSLTANASSELRTVAGLGTIGTSRPRVTQACRLERDASPRPPNWLSRRLPRA
ncbi:MAG: hypothetical protein ACJ8FY_28940, partial [Gemmataceae bacterium]